MTTDKPEVAAESNASVIPIMLFNGDWAGIKTNLL
jgi:hypothetical protein